MAKNDTLESALLAFVSAAGITLGGPIKLGSKPKSEATETTAKNRQDLLDSLTGVRAKSRWVVWVMVFLVLAAFTVFVSFAIYHRDNISFVAGSILGGSGILALLFRQIHSAHARLVSSETLLALLPNLPPAQWVKISVVLASEVFKVAHPSVA